MPQEPVPEQGFDARELVRRGYDRAAAAYERARSGKPPAELEALVELLEPGAQVLDIGCGAGVPVARFLAARFALTGVDISAEQVRRARRNVPGGHFILGDILQVELPPARFAAAVSFYAVFHLPREQHPDLFRRVHAWLKPGGYLLATLSLEAEEAYLEPDFFGAQMYWSNYSLPQYLEILSETGFRVLKGGVIGHGFADPDAPPERHPYVLAQAQPLNMR